jgi:broad specificity phosphatase PhoE
MLRALLVALALCFAGSADADDAAQPAPQQPGAKAAPAKPAAKQATKKKSAAVVRPTWIELSPEQRQTLAPLQDDWENFERERRLKWVGIAKRYPKMTAEEQARVQRRMQAWAKLTPEQRRQARENYKNLAKDKDRHGNLREQWAEYQALPPEERQSLLPPPADQKRR